MNKVLARNSVQGDIKRDDSFAVTQRVVTESALQTSSLLDSDTAPDDPAPTDSDYTVYNESEPTEYYIDSNLEVNTDSESGTDGAVNPDNAAFRTEENDGTASQPDESLPELKKTDSEPEPVEEMTVDKMSTMTLGEYMNAAGGNYELVWVPVGMQDGAIGIRNLAYPNFRFVGASGEITGVSEMMEGANVITISKEQYVNLKGAIEHDMEHRDISIDEIKTERAGRYDNWSQIYTGSFTYDLDSTPMVIQAEDGADIGNGITLGMTYNEIKNIVGDDFNFHFKMSGGGYFADSYKAVINFNYIGRFYTIGFELTEDEEEQLDKAYSEKEAQYWEWYEKNMDNSGQNEPFDTTLSIKNFNPKSSAAQIRNNV